MRFFPHAVTDLPVALKFSELEEEFTQKPGKKHQWHCRYTILLWLSLVCMLPFDLARFDAKGEAAGATLRRLEAIGKRFIGFTGIEREGAAVMLGRLYIRLRS